MDAMQRLLEESERIVVITHTHADLDSVGAAIGLAGTINAEVDIATPSDVQANASALLEDYAVIDKPDLTSYDLQVVVDAPSTQRIDPLDPTSNQIPLLVIDHHEPADLQDHATASYVDTESPSTALLVTKLLQNGGWEIPPRAAMALAAGTLDDTGFRAVVMPNVQEELVSLLEQADRYGEQLADLWHTETTWSERVATAKAVVRARGYKAGETILLISEVGGEETAAAHTLLGGNADIAVVLSDRSDEMRVIARTSERIEGKLSLPEDLLQPLADEFGGYAGGHAGAGVAKVKPTPKDAIEDHVVQCIEKALGLQFRSFS